ncbi:RecX family transcriptional regulator [Actinokineospora sp. NBRC 105648]|uniref:RecX family transcriptional regulator n=1 Tax=Actinokineospora sp. NBRC 105648 TaxID=3032206 RepID=UPI0024A5EE5F|nr:hypothetical protein Acsp05_22600 [Actinokineospora sp. NBRC 105648]
MPGPGREHPSREASPTTDSPSGSPAAAWWDDPEPEQEPPAEPAPAGWWATPATRPATDPVPIAWSEPDDGATRAEADTVAAGGHTEPTTADSADWWADSRPSARAPKAVAAGKSRPRRGASTAADTKSTKDTAVTEGAAATEAAEDTAATESIGDTARSARKPLSRKQSGVGEKPAESDSALSSTRVGGRPLSGEEQLEALRRQVSRLAPRPAGQPRDEPRAAPKRRSSRPAADERAEANSTADAVEEARPTRHGRTDRAPSERQAGARAEVNLPVDPVAETQPKRRRRPDRAPFERPSADRASRREKRESAEEDPAAKARDICYRQLAVRDRTRVELEQVLRRKEIPDDIAQAVIDKFDAAGLINDAAFAESWVRSRHEHRGLGRRALANELRRKGVDDAIVAEAVEAVDNDAEAERAGALVRKKLGSVRNLEDQVKIRRLVAMLARRGYAEGMAYRVVRAELDSDAADALDTLPD